MNIVIITQARMSSTRLPGKVLKEVLGQPLLVYHIERLKRVPSATQVVVATTTNPADDAIVRVCEASGCAYVRGSEEDVLSRYHLAARAYSADIVVRVTSDCPLIDPAVVDRIIRYYVEHRERMDYVANTVERTYPRGMDTEVFSFQALEEAHREAKLGYEREHVTPFFYTHPERYRMGNVAYHTDVSHHRWTVDTPEDFELIRRIIEALYPEKQDFTLEDVLALLDQHPEWTALNAHVLQKRLGE
ncbi:cytidylyltransferase domain-containing protein [Alicyclobacillus macrosporangiidus]|uniref:cytidylyltransferase domain-containing protein n=1 Tax=Alicyclobacillus macrosporangiidus TaxID=392015 RepID=UPI00049706B4|nr:glycosyltransferase family protein [Alicyclobacillus macrosporangiidus]